MHYKYATVWFVDVLVLTNLFIPDPSYPNGFRTIALGDNEKIEAVQQLLDEGYRWIRTDGELAVFELAY